MTIKKRIATLLLSFLLLFVIGGESILSAWGITASAETNFKTTSVIQDLTATENFSASDYPAMTYVELEALNQDADETNDQSFVEVIQVAESTSDYLYIYLYQPTLMETEYTINGILMYNGFSSDGVVDAKLYSVDLISSEGVFSKYRIRDFTLENETERYYNLVTIYRSFISGIDSPSSGSDIENYSVGIHVGQQWCAYEQDGKTVYEMNTFETVELDIGFTGSVDFNSGLTVNNFFGSFELGDAWFITFNIDNYVVEKIYDADVVYKTRDMSHSFGVGIDSTSYGEWSELKKFTLKEGDEIIYKGPGLFAKKYSCNKILSSQDFITQMEDQNVNIHEDDLKEIEEDQWVFVFLLTEKQINNYGNTMSTQSTDVASVGVVRLHFMDVNKDEYNLGVVSDLVNPDNNSDGTGSGIDDEFLDWLKFAVFILVCIFLWKPISALVRFVYSGFEILLSWILFILTFPIKVIKWFARK